MVAVNHVGHHDNHYPRCPHWLHKHLKFLVKSTSFAWKSNQLVMWGDVYGVICTIAFTDEQHYETDAQVWVPLTNKGNIADIKHHQGTSDATCCWWCTPQYTKAFNALVDQARTRQDTVASAVHVDNVGNVDNMGHVDNVGNVGNVDNVGHVDNTGNTGNAGNAGDTGNAGVASVAVEPVFVDTVFDGKQSFTIEVPGLDDASVDSDESTDRSSTVMSGRSSPSETCFTFGDFSVPIVGQDCPANSPATRMSNRPGNRSLADQDYSFTKYVVKVGHGSGDNPPVGLVIDTTTLHVQAAITVEMYNDWTMKLYNDGYCRTRSPLSARLSETLALVHPNLMYYMF